MLELDDALWFYTIPSLGLWWRGIHIFIEEKRLFHVAYTNRLTCCARVRR